MVWQRHCAVRVRWQLSKACNYSVAESSPKIFLYIVTVFGHDLIHIHIIPHNVWNILLLVILA